MTDFNNESLAIANAWLDPQVASILSLPPYTHLQTTFTCRFSLQKVLLIPVPSFHANLTKIVAFKSTF